METPPSTSTGDTDGCRVSPSGEQPQVGLSSASVILRAKLQARRRAVAAKCASLDQEIREAQAHQHRRARFNLRDRACYRLGAAFEPFDGLAIDDVALCGLLAHGQTAVSLLVDAVRLNPDASLVELLQDILLSPNGAALRVNGVHYRWTWLKALYHAETAGFRASPAGLDPKARWRLQKPTVNQHYLAGEIARLLQILPRRFSNRGAAFDWIETSGGNPQFHQEPSSADAAALGDACK